MAVHKQVRFNLFVTAMEGGINYWARVTVYRWRVRGTDDTEDLDNFVAAIDDLEDDKRYHIHPDTIEKGIERAAIAVTRDEIQNPYQRQAIALMAIGADDVDFDADTADIVIQYAVFGELVYN